MNVREEREREKEKKKTLWKGERRRKRKKKENFFFINKGNLVQKVDILTKTIKMIILDKNNKPTNFLASFKVLPILYLLQSRWIKSFGWNAILDLS